MTISVLQADGDVEVAAVFVAVNGAAALVFARASAAEPRLESQVASALALPPFASMNGFGALPLPTLI